MYLRILRSIICALALGACAAAHALTPEEFVGIWVYEYSSDFDDAANFKLNMEFRSDSTYRMNILDDPDCAPLFLGGQFELSGEYEGLNLLAMNLTGITCGPDSLDLTQFARPEDLGIGLFAIGLSDGKLFVYDLITDTLEVLSRAARLPATPEFPSFLYGSDAISADQLRVKARPDKGSSNRDLVVELNLSDTPVATFAAEGGYKVYVAAFVPGEVLGTPGQPQWFVRQPQGAPQPWSTISFPMAPFLENIALGAADSRLRMEILADTDLTKFSGTEFYIGYGLNEFEMLSAGRFRGFYKVN